MIARDWSEPASTATALVCTALLSVFVAAGIDMRVTPPPDEPDMVITMEEVVPEAPPPADIAPAASAPEEPPPPEPPPREPPPPEPPPPEPPPPIEPPPPPDAPPPVDPPPPPPPPRPVTPPRPVVPPRPHPPQPMTTPPGPAVPVPQSAAPTTAAPPSFSSIVEATFVGQLRAYIKSITRYPNSKEARLLHPTGAAEVGFTLSRGGDVQDVSLMKSSGIGVLDQQAVSIVRSGTYPRIPDNAWAGASAHRFTVTVEFLPT